MFKVLTKGCEPTRGSKYSAAVDLYASEDVVIGAGETKLVGLGVCIDIQNSNIYKTSDYRWAEKKEPCSEVLERIKQQAIRDFMREHYLQLMLRSSLGKKGLILPNGVGIIDLDYEDEIKMIISNLGADSECSVTEQGDLIYDNEMVKVDNLNSSYDNKSTRCFIIKKGDKIGQITLIEHKSYLMGIDTDEVRTGGFGSTGK